MLKLHKFKTNVQSKNKSSFGNTQCFLVQNISDLEISASEIRAILNWLK